MPPMAAMAGAPASQGRESNVSTQSEEKISLSALRSAIPSECFEKNLLRSLFYMISDLAILSTAFLVYPHVSGYFQLLMYWNFYGFFAWALFVVGHDCGHSSFSPYPIVNDICGHICHGLILVPYYPWARSHNQHHRYHNHRRQDRSHKWLTKTQIAGWNIVGRILVSCALGPVVGFWMYLIWGLSEDGSHIIWFGKLYKGASWTEKLKCVLSVSVVVAWGAIVYLYCGSGYEWMRMFGGVVTVCYTWLFMVTWYQHHGANTTVYDETTWTFLKGAVETVDRKVGYGIDALHHNITDCHLVHHMFFREIPHYNLSRANTEMQRKAAELKINHHFRYQDHTAYPFKYVMDFFSTFNKEGNTHWKLDTLDPEASRVFKKAMLLDE